jgi:hypothetical protein
VRVEEAIGDHMGTKLQTALFSVRQLRQVLLPDLDAFVRSLPDRLLPMFTSRDGSCPERLNLGREIANARS